MPQLTTNKKEQTIIAVINADQTVSQLISGCNFNEHTLMHFANGIELSSKWEKTNLNIVAIISQAELMGPSGISLFQTLQTKKFPLVPFFIITEFTNEALMHIALKAGITDVFREASLKKDALQNRVNFVIENWKNLNKATGTSKKKDYKTPFAKRIFDITFALLAILALSPLLLLIIIALKLESKGPIFYYSLRVGTGYKVFKFFKFRSMYVNADKKLKDLKHLNQYTADTQETLANRNTSFLCNECSKLGKKCMQPLYADKDTWCEQQFLLTKKTSAGATFFKLKDDPRITKVGKLLRNTSIDELPQLFNVLIGDMSIVGNRPLPLYEAEKLTTDKYALRFLAPAGITGLWQVEKRGKGEMSEEERLMLDNTYAKNHSFLNDMRLIMKTIPALFQKENV